jgi:hypothetical protein
MRDHSQKAWQKFMPNGKDIKELKVPLSPNRLSRLEGIHASSFVVICVELEHNQ